MPELLGDARRFARIFRTPIEKRQDGERRAVLSGRLKPFMLPPKTEMLRPLELAGQQRDLYETVRLAMHEKVRREVAPKRFARSHIVVLDALLKLGQVCCDPRLVKLAAARRVTASAKLEHLMEMLPQLVEDGRRILAFAGTAGSAWFHPGRVGHTGRCKTRKKIARHDGRASGCGDARNDRARFGVGEKDALQSGSADVHQKRPGRIARKRGQACGFALSANPCCRPRDPPKCDP